MKKITKLVSPLFFASVLLSSQSLAASKDEIVDQCRLLGMEVLHLTDNHYSEKCHREVNYSGAAIMGAANLINAGDFKSGLTNLKVAERRLTNVANSPERCAYFSPLIKLIMPRVVMMQNVIEQEGTNTSR